MACEFKEVTAGPGGNPWLIVGNGKTALYDTGMAYCGNELVQNIKRELGEKPLDYILLSHSHYDHLGALTYVKQAWPNVIVVAGAHAKLVLEKPNALALIRKLSVTAANEYSGKAPVEDLDYHDEDMKIDLAVEDGQIIDFGDTKIKAILTPGHTRCSVAYYIIEDQVMFASETTGVLAGHTVQPVILTGYKDTMDSIEKCRKYPCQRIFNPHHGQISDKIVSQYWDMSKEAMEDCMGFVRSLVQSGATREEILAAYTKKYRIERSAREQPIEAFIINAEATINVIEREFK